MLPHVYTVVKFRLFFYVKKYVTIMTCHGNIRSYLHRLKNYSKSRVPKQTRHTKSRLSDILVQKAKELNRNSEEQCT